MTQLASMGGDTAADDNSAGQGATIPPEPYALGYVDGPPPTPCASWTPGGGRRTCKGREVGVKEAKCESLNWG